jgi:hypothetical protein
MFFVSVASKGFRTPVGAGSIWKRDGDEKECLAWSWNSHPRVSRELRSKRLKRVEMRALLCVACLLSVEKVGSVWSTDKVAAEVKNAVGVSREVAGLVDKNIGNGSMGLARK